MSIVVDLHGIVRSPVPVTNVWSQTSGPTADITDESSPITTATLSGGAGTYVFKLTSTTNNDDHFVGEDSVSIVAATYVAATANAGPDKSGILDSPVTLEGSATIDSHIPAGDVTYSWAMTSGTGVATFSPSANVATPSVSVSATGNKTFTLTVSDGITTNAQDTMTLALTSAFGTQWAAPAQIPATPSSVALTDVEYLVDMSKIPNTGGNQFWGTLVGYASDTLARNSIRLTIGATTQVPFDLIDFDRTNRTGFIVFKYSTAGAAINGPTNSLRIWTGGTGFSALSATNPYGQYNAYGSDCKAFWAHGGLTTGNAVETDRTSNQVVLGKNGAPTFSTTTPWATGVGHSVFDGVDDHLAHLISTINAPITLAAATTDNGTSGDDGIMGVVRTDNLTVDSLNNCHRIVVNATSDQVSADARDSNNRYRATCAKQTSATNNWRMYMGSFSSASVPTAVSANANATDGTPGPIADQDYCVIGGFPRLSVENHLTGGIALASIWNTQKTTNWLTYRGQMMDQATFYGTWTLN